MASNLPGCKGWLIGSRRFFGFEPLNLFSAAKWSPDPSPTHVTLVWDFAVRSCLESKCNSLLTLPVNISISMLFFNVRAVLYLNFKAAYSECRYFFGWYCYGHCRGLKCANCCGRCLAFPIFFGGTQCVRALKSTSTVKYTNYNCGVHGSGGDGGDQLIHARATLALAFKVLDRIYLVSMSCHACWHSSTFTQVLRKYYAEFQ